MTAEHRQRSAFAGLLNLSDKTTFYYRLSRAAVRHASVCRGDWSNSRFGMVIQGVRSNERRMRAIGFPTFRYKLDGFVIAGAICGLAGALLANHTEFVSPSTMFWTRSGDLIVMVVLGGMGTLFGPVFGAVALFGLEESCRGHQRGGAACSSRPCAWRSTGRSCLGRCCSLVVLFARGGIDGLLRASAACRSDGRSLAGRAAHQALRRDRRLRRFRSMCRRANCTQSSVRTVPARRTLIAQLSGGDRRPMPVASVSTEQDVTELPAWRRSQLGLARSFQITSLFLDFTALDNVALAVQAHAGHSFHFWADARREAEPARIRHARR